jgi:surface protein
MFNRCESLTSLDLSLFNTSNVTDMQRMFTLCRNLVELDLSSFDTSNVTNMKYMFADCINLTSLDLSSFDMSNVEILDDMLERTSNMLTITTPKKMFDSGLEINLYGDFEDEAGNVYSVLNKDTPTKITIHR